ncbi:MAG: SDR family NAD(P)-dependent oxidoreductase [Rhodospirillaceae bacterium]|nr:MAG: SDR family NAD(P)-dependent oxidoreductase [Rhodospirillaceae bacterium]
MQPINNDGEPDVTDISFKDRVVVITGAGGGLGRTYALEIARRGGAVVVNDLGGQVDGTSGSSEMADRVAAEIRSAGGRAVANYDSITTPQAGERIANAAIESFGRIDALINNAGNLRNAAMVDLSEDDRDAVWAVHLAGTFNVTKPIFHQMVKQGYGRIVFTSSAAGLFGNAEQSAYGAAKAGVVGLMNVLAQEGTPHGILCNALAPSAFSRMAEKVNLDHAEKMNALVAPFLSALDPTFVTPIVVYLASEACHTTHDIYSATGGRIARIFVGLSEGWLGPRDKPATVEQIAARIDTIRDTSRFQVPGSLVDEFHILANQIAKS